MEVELDATSSMRSLDRRDADMALRPSEDPPEDAVGRRVARLAWAAYRPSSTRRRLPWLPYVGPLSQLKGPRVPMEQPAEPGTVLCARTVSAMQASIGEGIGCGALPCYIGDGDPRMRRASEPHTPDHSALWLLLHADLRNSARIRAVIDLLSPALAAHRSLFEGDCKRGSSGRREAATQRRSPRTRDRSKGSKH